MTHAGDYRLVLRGGRTGRLLARPPIALHDRSVSACTTTALLPIP